MEKLIALDELVRSISEIGLPDDISSLIIELKSRIKKHLSNVAKIAKRPLTPCEKLNIFILVFKSIKEIAEENGMVFPRRAFFFRRKLSCQLSREGDEGIIRYFTRNFEGDNLSYILEELEEQIASASYTLDTLQPHPLCVGCPLLTDGEYSGFDTDYHKVYYNKCGIHYNIDDCQSPNRSLLEGIRKRIEQDNMKYKNGAKAYRILVKRLVKVFDRFMEHVDDELFTLIIHSINMNRQGNYTSLAVQFDKLLKEEILRIYLEIDGSFWGKFIKRTYG